MHSLWRVPLAATVAVFLIAGSPSRVCAGHQRTGNFELSTMGGLVVAQGGGVSFSIPNSVGSITPGLRAAIWTPSNLIFNLGFSYFGTSGGGGSLTQMEGGLGKDLAPPRSAFRPCVNVLFGLISLSSEGVSQSSGFIGAELGARSFFRDYAAARFAVAYRHSLGNNFDFNLLELAGGLSFFLGSEHSYHKVASVP